MGMYVMNKRNEKGLAREVYGGVQARIPHKNTLNFL